MKKLIHATSVEFKGIGILIVGKSGVGKSDLAMRMIEEGGLLVCDDQTQIENIDGELMAFPAPNIEGKIELRGVGIIDVSFIKKTRIKLILNLVDDFEKVERLPDLEKEDYLGVKIAKFNLYPFETSSIIKIRYMLNKIL